MFLSLGFQTTSANPISSGREIPMTILDSRFKTTLLNCKKIPNKAQAALHAHREIRGLRS